MKAHSISDYNLLSQIRLGDTAAFDLLFDRYWEKLYRVAFARLHNVDDAKDLVQELLINFWNRRERVEIKTTLESYLFGSLKLSIISYFRSLKSNDLRLDDVLERINILEESVTDLEDYLQLEHILDKAVNLMPETLRKIYTLRCDNVPVKEIALQLGLADQTVKNYISELLRRLRQNISEKYPEKHLTYIFIFLSFLTHK